jgi:hypothetical protein
LVSFDPDDCYADVVCDHDLFADPSTEHQHVFLRNDLSICVVSPRLFPVRLWGNQTTGMVVLLNSLESLRETQPRESPQMSKWSGRNRPPPRSVGRGEERGLIQSAPRAEKLIEDAQPIMSVLRG